MKFAPYNSVLDAIHTLIIIEVAQILIQLLMATLFLR